MNARIRISLSSGVGLDQREQLLAIELDHLARLADAQARHRAAAGDHVAFAGELPGAVGHDQRLRTLGRPEHLDFAADDDEKRRPVAELDQHVASRRRSSASVNVDASNLLCGECRERVFEAGFVHAKHNRSLELNGIITAGVRTVEVAAESYGR